MSVTTLFDTHSVGTYTTKNRIVMPPMSRLRAKRNIPNKLMAKYYRQRTGAGLIVTEGVNISQQAQGAPWSPGIFSTDQVAGWKQVTDAVHQRNGLIFAQLWHVGALSHTSFQPGANAPVSSSPIYNEGVNVHIKKEKVSGPIEGEVKSVQHSKARALTIPEIKETIDDYARAAANAKEAGFDGVELHGANGYLIKQFLDSGANERMDKYGGSLQNRLRFLKEVTEATVEVMGKNKVGVRLSPLHTAMGIVDDHPEETYVAAARLLNELGVAYIHIAEADWDDAPLMPVSFKESLRGAFSGTMIYTGKYNKQKADDALQQGWADMIGFGRPFIANPDLPYRFKYDLPLAEANPDTFYGGSAKGYTDYPTASEADLTEVKNIQ